MTRMLLLVALLLPLPAAAQVVTFPVQSLPVPLTVTWDNDTDIESPPTSYELTLDNDAPISVPAGPVPCESCVQSIVTFSTTGVHTLALRARNAAGVSSPVTLEVTITFLVTVPRAPSRLRVVLPATLPSPPGTIVPPSANLTAPDLSVWALSPPLADAAAVCPGATEDRCRSVLINGKVVPGGNAYELLIASDGTVWLHTFSGLWYRAGSSVGQVSPPQ